MKPCLINKQGNKQKYWGGTCRRPSGLIITQIKARVKEVFIISEKKMGRPIMNNRKCSLHLRISEQELNLISECAELSGLNRTDTIIQGIKLLKNTLQ